MGSTKSTVAYTCGHNVDWVLLDQTQKAAQGNGGQVPGAGEGNGKRMKFHFGHPEFEMPVRSSRWAVENTDLELIRVFQAANIISMFGAN